MEDSLVNGGVQNTVDRILTEPRFEKYSPKLMHDEFPLVQFDDFLTKEECHTLFETSGDLERSTDHGEKNEFGEAKRLISNGRTSLNAWCREHCMNHPLVQNIIDRIENVTSNIYSLR